MVWNVVAQLRVVGNRANVVFVTVCDDHADDVVEPICDPREIREDEVDAGLVDLGEEDTAVDDEELALVFEDVHVTADLAQTSQGDDAQGPIFEGGGLAKIFVQRLHVADSTCSYASTPGPEIHSKTPHSPGAGASAFEKPGGGSAFEKPGGGGANHTPRPDQVTLIV